MNLTAAREQVLRAVARGEVTRNNRDDTRPCWDRGRRKAVTVQVKWLRNAGMVTYNVDLRAGWTPVTLTPAGREWLDANPEKGAD